MVMRIDEIEVGTHYRIGVDRRVVALKVEKLYDSYSRRNVRHVLVAPVSRETGEVDYDEDASFYRRAADIAEPWAQYLEKERQRNERELPLRKAEAELERALERVDVDAEVQARHTYGRLRKGHRTGEFHVTLELNDTDLPHFLEVLERAVQYAEEAGLENKVEITEYDQLKETLAETRNEDGNG
jgi:hypothetical protein